MELVCPGCGEWSSERPVRDGMVVCDCGHRQRIVLRPLLLVTGASGTGKSTLVLWLAGRLTEVVVLDGDVLWMPEMDTPQDNWRRFRGLWLRMAANIAQSGRPLLLFNSGPPDDYEHLPERQYIGTMHTLVLVCSDGELRRRLKARPAWRKSASEEFIGAMLPYNRALRTLAESRPDVALVDTTLDDPEVSAAVIATWVRDRLGCGGEAW